MSKLVITCGDPAGVGPEIIHDLAQKALLPSGCAVIGPASFLDHLPECLEKIPCGSSAYIAQQGTPTLEGAEIAHEALCVAADLCNKGAYEGVVTAPVSKSELQKVGFKHPGQTEFFAAKWGGVPSMAFAGERMRLVLATWHIPLKSIFDALDRDALCLAIERASILASAMGKKSPKIGVCGLNPHAGEGGILGEEEESWINPLLSELQAVYPGLSLAEPADTLFYRHMQGEFDAVVALYHDQGLAPLKTVEFYSAVNLTLGLSYLRTSPDHGTGYGIAGKGIASSRSFHNAIKFAQKLINNV